MPNALSPPPLRTLLLIFLSLLLTAAAFSRGPLFRDEVGMWAETVKRSPDKQRPRHNFGCALARAGQYDAAIRAFDDALAKEPDGTVILHFCHIEIGNAHYHMKRYGDAVAAWKKALALSPGNAEILTNLAEGLVRQGKADEAWGYIQGALAASSPYPETHAVLGDILLARGDAAAAAAAFVAALGKNPELAAAYRGAASAYEKLGDYGAAVHYLEQYLPRAADGQDRTEAAQNLIRLKEKMQKKTK